MGSVKHQLGLGTQVDYTTKLDPVTKWYPVLPGSGVKQTTVLMESKGMVPDRRLPLASQVNQVTRAGAGALNMEVPRTEFGHILQHMLGTNSPTSVQQGATTAYLQTFILGGMTKSFTMQTGIQRVDTPTTVEPFTAIGCKLPSWELGVEQGDFVKLTSTVHARDVLDSGNDAETLDTASYSTSQQLYSWEHCALTIDGVAVPLVNNWKLSAAMNMAADRYHLGSGGLQSEPRNVFGDVFSGSFNADFSALTNWYDRFHDNTTVALVFTATADVISGAFSQTLTVTMPAVKLLGDGPLMMDGLVNVDVPYQVYTPSASEAITITYMTTSTTV